MGVSLLFGPVPSSLATRQVSHEQLARVSAAGQLPSLFCNRDVYTVYTLLRKQPERSAAADWWVVASVVIGRRRR